MTEEKKGKSSSKKWKPVARSYDFYAKTELVILDDGKQKLLVIDKDGTALNITHLLAQL